MSSPKKLAAYLGKDDVETGGDVNREMEEMDEGGALEKEEDKEPQDEKMEKEEDSSLPFNRDWLHLPKCTGKFQSCDLIHPS